MSSPHRTKTIGLGRDRAGCTNPSLLAGSPEVRGTGSWLRSRCPRAESVARPPLAPRHRGRRSMPAVQWRATARVGFLAKYGFRLVLRWVSTAVPLTSTTLMAFPARRRERQCARWRPGVLRSNHRMWAKLAHMRDIATRIRSGKALTPAAVRRDARSLRTLAPRGYFLLLAHACGPQ